MSGAFYLKSIKYKQLNNNAIDKLIVIGKIKSLVTCSRERKKKTNHTNKCTPQFRMQTLQSVCGSCWLLPSCHVFELMCTLVVYSFVLQFVDAIFDDFIYFFNISRQLFLLHKDSISCSEVFVVDDNKVKKNTRKWLMMLKKSMFCDHCSSCQK